MWAQDGGNFMTIIKLESSYKEGFKQNDKSES